MNSTQIRFLNQKNFFLSQLFSSLLIFCVVFFSKSTELTAVYEVAVCAIFQNEAPYLKEWIEFHKLQGVEHFYLYNNNSEDNFLEVLYPYRVSNEVTLVRWPFTYDYADHDKWIDIQSSAYMHCITTYGEETKWVAAIDIDEFLFCPNGESLPNFLESYKEYGGLCVNWLKFGTSGVEDIPPGVCMIELLVHRSENSFSENKWIKSIVQPSRVAGCYCPHFFVYHSPYFAVDENEKKTIFFNESRPIEKIRINHYWTRTEKYFFANKIDSRLKRRPDFTANLVLEIGKHCNARFDTVILRHLDNLRSAMGYK